MPRRRYGLFLRDFGERIRYQLFVGGKGSIRVSITSGARSFWNPARGVWLVTSRADHQALLSPISTSNHQDRKPASFCRQAKIVQLEVLRGHSRKEGTEIIKNIGIAEGHLEVVRPRTHRHDDTVLVDLHADVPPVDAAPDSSALSPHRNDFVVPGGSQHLVQICLNQFQAATSAVPDAKPKPHSPGASVEGSPKAYFVVVDKAHILYGTARKTTLNDQHAPLMCSFVLLQHSDLPRTPTYRLSAKLLANEILCTSDPRFLQSCDGNPLCRSAQEEPLLTVDRDCRSVLKCRQNYMK